MSCFTHPAAKNEDPFSHIFFVHACVHQYLWVVPPPPRSIKGWKYVKRMQYSQKISEIYTAINKTVQEQLAKVTGNYINFSEVVLIWHLWECHLWYYVCWAYSDQCIHVNKNYKITDWVIIFSISTSLSFSVDLPSAVLSLLTNPTYVFVCLAATSEFSIVTGFIRFVPKFIESQFNISASSADLLTGNIEIHTCLLTCNV